MTTDHDTRRSPDCQTLDAKFPYRVDWLPLDEIKLPDPPCPIHHCYHYHTSRPAVIGIGKLFDPRGLKYVELVEREF